MTDINVKDKIWNQLQGIALQDGELTDEEQDLISAMITDLEKYTKTLQEAMKDVIIDDKEEKELFEGRMAIMEKAYAKAREDLTISEDEKNILKEICKIVRTLQ